MNIYLPPLPIIPLFNNTSLGAFFPSSVTNSIIPAVPTATPAMECPGGHELTVCVFINVDSASLMKKQWAKLPIEWTKTYLPFFFGAWWSEQTSSGFFCWSVILRFCRVLCFSGLRYCQWENLPLRWIVSKCLSINGSACRFPKLCLSLTVVLKYSVMCLTLFFLR